MIQLLQKDKEKILEILPKKSDEEHFLFLFHHPRSTDP